MTDITPFTTELRAELDRDQEIFGIAFASKVNGTWVRLQPDSVVMLTRSPPPAPKKTTLEDLEDQIKELEIQPLGYLRRYINSEYETRIRFMPGLTPEEQALFSRPDKLACVKAVRERTGLGLADSKEFVERWLNTPSEP